MREKSEMILWGSVVFVTQILLILVQMVQYGRECVYQPLKFLCGDGYGRAGLYGIEQYMWMLELSLFCVMTVRKIVRYREEASYMMIVRYPDFRSYYGMAYETFVKYTVLYQAAVCLGALTGVCVVRIRYSVLDIHWRTFLLSQECMILGNLCFGVVMFYLILHFNAVKLAVVLYPGLPVAAIALREQFPRTVNNWNPGSWLMAARSSEMVSEGFSLDRVFLIEIILFIAVSMVAVRKKYVK